MNKTLVASFLLLIASSELIQGANVVFFFGIASYSHTITVWPLVESLADNGHNVTFISGHKQKKPHPKVAEFQPKSLVEWMATWEDDEGPQAFANRKSGPGDDLWFELPEWGQHLCKILLEDEEYVDWIQKTPVDLVVLDSLCNDCGYAIAHQHKAKHMVFGTTTILPWQYDSYGIPAETSWIPDMVYFYPQNMTFMERVYSTVYPIYWTYVRDHKYFPYLENLMKEKLGLEVKLREMERETSLVLLNTYFAEEFSRSLPPLIVPVGGMHCKEKTQPLPKEMETFINKAGSKAFVYISFGSAVRISQSPQEIQDAFFNTIKNMPHVQFVWKWEGEFPKLSLPNVLFVKWAPQQDILAHPKIRAFVSHSGLLGIQEAIYHGVPLISMPVFAEQDYNAERVHRLEHGIRLEITDVTEEQLESAITKILNNPKYAANMKLMSKRFKDRPMKPAETALWWTEYILRHENTSHLAPLSVYQTWYQRRLLDVWAFVALILVLISSIVIFVFVRVGKCLFASQSKSAAKIKKN